MRVMYWNCTAPAGGTSVFDETKRAMISNRILAVQPSIVCLDEVSAKISNKAQADVYANSGGAGSFGATYKAACVSENPGTHLNQVVYVANTTKGCKTAEGIPSGDWDGEQTKRNLTRVTWQNPVTTRLIYIWFIHANASVAGGKLAVDLALIAMKGQNAVFIGDFNSSGVTAVDTAKAVSLSFAVLPKTLSAKGVAYTQWSKAERAVQTDPDYQITGTVFDFKPSPWGCLDFAVASGGVTVTAIDALTGLNADAVGQVMMNMDHFPVAYDITAS